MTANDQAQAPLSFVDNTGSATVDSFMRRHVAGAHRNAVCVGYVSEKGLTRLADWLDRMAPDSQLRLLIGMAPHGWTFLAQSAEAHAKYLLRSLQTKAPDLDRALLQRLAGQMRAGRLQLRLRDPRNSIHAKLYLIQTASQAWTGLAGSSNLSGSGLMKPGEFNLVLAATMAAQASHWMNQQWDATSSQPADDVWQKLLMLNMTTPALKPDIGNRRLRPGRLQHRPSGRASARRTRRSGCWELVLGLLLLAGGLLLFLWTLLG